MDANGTGHLLAHVLAVQQGVARHALETPDVPLRIERYQCLAFDDLLPTAGAFFKCRTSQ